MHVCVNNEDITSFYVQKVVLIQEKNIIFLITNMQFNSFEYDCILVPKNVLYQQTGMLVN